MKNVIIIKNCGFSDLCDCKAMPEKYCAMKRIARLCDEEKLLSSDEIWQILEPVKI